MAPATIDLIRLSVDGGEGEHFAVMAGMGIDAMIMDETPDDLKDKIGTAAYFVAAARAMGRLPVPMRIKVDDHHTHRRRAMICVVGNVGGLPGNITLIPGAEPDDGLLDVYVASPHRFTQWIRVFARLVTRRSNGQDRVDQWRGRRVEVRLERPDSYQLDGDVVGELRRLVAEVQPQALSVRVTVLTPQPSEPLEPKNGQLLPSAPRLVRRSPCPAPCSSPAPRVSSDPIWPRR